MADTSVFGLSDQLVRILPGYASFYRQDTHCPNAWTDLEGKVCPVIGIVILSGEARLQVEYEGVIATIPFRFTEPIDRLLE